MAGHRGLGADDVWIPWLEERWTTTSERGEATQLASAHGVSDDETGRRAALEFRLQILEGHLTVFDCWSEFADLAYRSPDRWALSRSLKAEPFGFSDDVATYWST